MTLQSTPTLGDHIIPTIFGAQYETQNAGQPWSLRKQGSYLRFEVRNGDIWLRGNSQRSEVRNYSTYPFNTDIWISMAIRINGGVPQVDGNALHYFVIGQMHSTSNANPGDIAALSPPWSQRIDQNGNFVVEARTSTANPITANPVPDTLYTLTDLPRDTWVRMVHRIVFSNSGGGHLQSWRDGSQIYDEDAAIGYNQPDAGYFKYGIYRWPTTPTGIVEYANVEVGTADLSSRVTSPLPLPA